MNFSVFLSYSRTDDRPYEQGDDGGWVRDFHERLQNRMNVICDDRKLGFRCAVFRDITLPGNAEVDSRISAALTNANAFIALLSRNFLKSTWCGREGSTFQKDLFAQFPAGDPRQEGIFIADCENIWEEAKDPLKAGWNQAGYDPTTVDLILALRKRLASAYTFFKKETEGAQRICDPVFYSPSDEAGLYKQQLEKLANQVLNFLSGLPSERSEVIQVLLAPPIRNSGNCWKDYKALWMLLSKEALLKLCPIFGPDLSGDISLVERLDPVEYCKFRLPLLNELPTADLMIQMLGVSLNEWDDTVVKFWRLGNNALLEKNLSAQMHVSALDKDDRLDTIAAAKGVTDKNMAQKMGGDAACCPYSSIEDLVKQTIDKAKLLLGERAHQARKDAKANGTPVAPTRDLQYPVLVEACAEDQVLAMSVQEELSRQGLKFQNRDYFKEDNVLLGLDTLPINSIVYVCERGKRSELLGRAIANIRELAQAGKKLPPRGALYYSPPQSLGFAAGSSYAFSKDFPMELRVRPDAEPPEAPVAQLADDQAITKLRALKLKQSVGEFRDWILNEP